MLRGAGASRRPTVQIGRDARRAGRFRRFGVEWLTGLVDALGADQVDIVGSSMGGYLGRVFALAQPECDRRLVQIG
jgi:pimeloyl-ACP methyl ester carboxylesterase